MARVQEVSRKLPFMFLGGPLDHATRMINTVGPLLTPENDAIHVPVLARPYTQVFDDAPLGERVTYRRHRATDGLRSWWVYILEGHSPSVSTLLDANPHPI